MVRPKNDEIPVRIASFSDLDVNLASGTLLGYLHSSSCSNFDDFQVFENKDIVYDYDAKYKSSENPGTLPKANKRKTLPPVDLSKSVLDSQQRNKVF